jgi:hypothetical protein
MNDNSLIQPFSGIGYKPIHVKMYLKGVQLIVNKTTTDDEEKKELFPLYFYNSLRGEAKQWFDGLNTGIQGDWDRLKEEFLKRFGQEDSEKQQRLYFYQQVKAIRQGSKSIPEYLKEGEALATLAMNEDMAFILAQAFIDGLNNVQHRQMLDLILSDTLYTFQDVKAAVRKLHARSPGTLGEDLGSRGES